MSWFIYILECADNSFYTGITWNLKRRIEEHNQGICSCLHDKHRPVKLAYWERVKDRFEAAKREKRIKHLSHEKKRQLIENLIEVFKYSK